jgi:hypothetical protein
METISTIFLGEQSSCFQSLWEYQGKGLRKSRSVKDKNKQLIQNFPPTRG